MKMNQEEGKMRKKPEKEDDFTKNKKQKRENKFNLNKRDLMMNS